MEELYTEIEIDASPEQVWNLLVDFVGYRQWNPFIVDAVGVARPGAELRVVLAPPGARGVTMRPTVTEVVAAQSLEWLGHLGVRGLFDGRHRFELHDTGDGCRLVQRETFTGVLVPLFARSLDESTAQGFRAMNAALKRRAEQTVGISPRP